MLKRNGPQSNNCTRPRGTGERRFRLFRFILFSLREINPQLKFVAIVCINTQQPYRNCAAAGSQGSGIASRKTIAQGGISFALLLTEFPSPCSAEQKEVQYAFDRVVCGSNRWCPW